jgi:hypothetical protein
MMNPHSMPLPPGSFSRSAERGGLSRGDDPSAMLGSGAASVSCPILRRFEELVEAVLTHAPPSLGASDADWVRLFRYCDKHRVLLAERAKMWNKLAEVRRVDVWLHELARPPKGAWEGVRHGAMPYIRLVGLAPRGAGGAMFTKMDHPPTAD